MKLGENPSREEALEYAEFKASEGKREARETFLKSVGLDADMTNERVKDRLGLAADGEAYRNDLLEQLKGEVVRVKGNDEAGQAAAERSRKTYANAPLEDIKAEIESLGAMAALDVPGKKSEDPKEEDEKEKAQAVKPFAYG